MTTNIFVYIFVYTFTLDTPDIFQNEAIPKLTIFVVQQLTNILMYFFIVLMGFGDMRHYAPINPSASHTHTCAASAQTSCASMGGAACSRCTTL